MKVVDFVDYRHCAIEKRHNRYTAVMAGGEMYDSLFLTCTIDNQVVDIDVFLDKLPWNVPKYEDAGKKIAGKYGEFLHTLFLSFGSDLAD